MTTPLLEGYVIHHLNGDKLDNRPENLAAWLRKEHSASSVMVEMMKRIKELEAIIAEKAEGDIPIAGPLNIAP